MTDPSATPPRPNEKAVAFCQNCGKPLDQTTVRIVGQAVFCEPCLAARLAGAPATPPPSQGYGNPFQPQPSLLPPAPPNPGLAALLGLIPGVGAMYNEQYGKGIVHLMVFAVLISLSNASSLFGLMAFGWICYMIIEAHHTARARRDGLPLPNPFGLNEVSERLGFYPNWGARPHTPWQAQTAPPAPEAGPQPPPSATNPPVAAWGAPSSGGQEPAAAYGAPRQQSHYTGFSPSGQPAGNGEWNNPTSYPPIPPMPPVPPYPDYGAAYAQVPTGSYAPPAPDYAAQFAAQRQRFPVGAVWLIGLGILFLLATTGVFSSVPLAALSGFALIGLAVWLYMRRMFGVGSAAHSTDAQTPFQLRTLRGLRAPIWIFFVGFLMLLNSFRVLQFYRSWPWFVVLAGVMMLAERLVSNSPVASPPAPSTAVPPYVAQPATGSEPYVTPRDGDL